VRVLKWKKKKERASGRNKKHWERRALRGYFFFII